MDQKGGLTIAMKKPFIFLAVISVVALVSCQKEQTEAEKNAEIDRKVQERLAAEHQAQQQQQLDQRQADLEAREKSLAEKGKVASAPQRSERTESETVESRPRPSEPRERAITTGYSTFYNKLEPYGDWIETGDYGYVFHPRQGESSRAWRPYTDGRWVYTDAGWTWISEEPFGWATYHYGRWTRLRGIGWVWVPGNQWAPAWVSWRKGNDYVGWAPLPPEARFDQRIGIHNWSDSYYDVGPDQYCFVASREFGAPRLERTLLPPERNVTIINQTTNVTNITYDNTTIVNEGPSFDELRSVSREPVQRYRLERNVNIGVTSEPPRPEMRGETVVIAAPVIGAPVANERPPTVKQTLAAAAIDLGWAAIANQDEAKKTRQKMKSEATPPPNAPSKKFVKAEAATNAPAQSADTSATSTSTTATPAPSVAAVAATSTPRQAATIAPAATISAISTPISAPPVAPTASQRRGRLLVPSATPAPRTAPSATLQPEASKSPTYTIPVAPPPSATVSSTTTPAPSVSSNVQLPAEATRGKSKSQTQSFNPRKAEPMAPPSAPVTSTSSPNAESSSSPSEKLTKKEKKELRREERQEMKRQRKEGIETPSPSPAP
jgi:hypothetical protein